MGREEGRTCCHSDRGASESGPGWGGGCGRFWLADQPLPFQGTCFPRCYIMGTTSSNELFKYLRAWKDRLNCWKSEKILVRLGTLGKNGIIPLSFKIIIVSFLKGFVLILLNSFSSMIHEWNQMSNNNLVNSCGIVSSWMFVLQGFLASWGSRHLHSIIQSIGAFQVVLVWKNLPANAVDARDADLIPGSGRSPGAGNGNPLRSSCLGNSIDKRSLVGYSPWGCNELATTQHTHTHT